MPKQLEPLLSLQLSRWRVGGCLVVVLGLIVYFFVYTDADNLLATAKYFDERPRRGLLVGMIDTLEDARRISTLARTLALILAGWVPIALSGLFIRPVLMAVGPDGSIIWKERFVGEARSANIEDVELFADPPYIRLQVRGSNPLDIARIACPRIFISQTKVSDVVRSFETFKNAASGRAFGMIGT